MSEQLVPLGKIVTTHGLEGWLKLNPYNPQTPVLSPNREIFLEKNGLRSAHRIESTRPHKGRLLIKLLGVDLIDDAERWIGSTLSVAEEELQSLEAGEYYHYQVIGLEVFDVRGKRIGTVFRTWSTPAGIIYVVAGESKEHLIPAVKEIVEKVDLNAGRIVINPPAGLLDL
ncbi:MAG: ribosome maturation factor RimM [Candidatus Binatia bacterium]